MNIKVLSWNCQSLNTTKLYSLKNFLNDTSNPNSYHLIFLQETWLNASIKISLPHYNCVRKDRNKQSQYPHGGVIIFVRKDINYKTVAFCNLDFMEAVFVEIDTGIFPIKFGSVYSTSKMSRKNSKSDFIKLLSRNGPFVLAGDFNAKHPSWNNPSFNPITGKKLLSGPDYGKGSDLKEICDHFRVELCFPDHPTLSPDNNKGTLSTVDFVLAKSVYDITKPTTIFDLCSDHRPIEFTIKANLSFPLQKMIPNYKKADWKLFRETISSRIFSHLTPYLSSPETINDEIEFLNQIIIEAKEKSIPLMKPPRFRYPNSPEIDFLVRQRRQLRKSNLKYLPGIRSQINALNKKIKLLTSNLITSNWNDKCQTLITEDLSLYSLIRKVKNKFNDIPTLQDSSNNLIFHSQEKANLIAETFRTAHMIPPEPTIHTPAVNESMNTLSILPVDVPHIERVRSAEVKSLFETLKIKKACGYDNITNRLVKNSPPNLIDNLVNVFNSCLRLSYFPNTWKIGKVVAIPKPNKNIALPGSYRPITLLPTFGKLFEKIILSRLKDFESENEILMKQQFGFRSHHSTTHQIYRLVEIITSRFNENISTAMTLLDIEKAFDRVWHEGLLHKLMSSGLPTYLTKIIQSFLIDRFSYVMVNGQDSLPYKVPAGVPQGSPLSPYLFNFYINDTPVPQGCKISFFADDTALTASGKNHDLPKIVGKLDRGLDEISQHFDSWKISLNSSKTEAILFTKSTKMQKLSLTNKIAFGSSSLDWKNQAKYLGVILDSKMTFKPNIEYNVSKARKAVSSLYCFLKRSSHVPLKSKITIYKSYIRPLLTYACPAYAHIAKTHLNKLQVQQNKTLRMTLNAPYRTRISKLHGSACVSLMEEYIGKLTDNFYKRCNYSENPLIKRLGVAKLDISRKMKHRMPKRN